LAAVVNVPSRASVRNTRRSSQFAFISMFINVHGFFQFVD
jgi:hypothetical protein